MSVECFLSGQKKKIGVLLLYESSALSNGTDKMAVLLNAAVGTVISW